MLCLSCLRLWRRGICAYGVKLVKVTHMIRAHTAATAIGKQSLQERCAPLRLNTLHCLTLQTPRVYSELGKSAFSFCEENGWNYLQHTVKINCLTVPGQLKTMYTFISNIFLCIYLNNNNCLCISTSVQMRETSMISEA